MITPKKTVSFTWSIFWPLIKSWIVWFVRFWHGLNTMNLVFFKFNESLLALNHNDNLFSSAFSILVRQSLSLWDTKTFVSSANNISCNIVDVLIISLMLYRWCICKFCIDKNSLRVLRPYRAQPSHCFWWIECNRAKENQRFHMFAPACKWI